MHCDERDRLTAEVQEKLRQLADLAHVERELLARHDQDAADRVDKQIENALGDKERLMGALKYHRHEHGC